MDNSLVQRYTEIKAQMEPLKRELKDLDEIRRELEVKITEDMQADGLTLARTDFGTPSLTKETVPNVGSWISLEGYIYENKALHLVQRRVASPAFREIWKQGFKVPGVDPFDVTKFHFSNKKT